MGMRIIGGLRATGGSSHTHDTNTPLEASHMIFKVWDGDDPLKPSDTPPTGLGNEWFESLPTVPHGPPNFDFVAMHRGTPPP